MSNWVEITIFILLTLLIHLIGLSTQALSGKQYFYGVYIKNIELDEKSRNKISKDYKKRLNLSFILVVLLFLVFGVILDTNPGLNIALLMLLYIAFMTFCLKKAYDEVKFLKGQYLISHEINIEKKNIIQKKLTIDTELLKEKAKIKKKFTILFGFCVGLSVLSLIYVISKYNSLPDVIITHWGASGKPDGFSDKTIFNVFFTNIIDISMVILLAYMGIGMIGMKTYIEPSKIEVNRKKAIKYLNGIGYSLLLLTLSVQMMTTTIPIYMVNQSNIPVGIVIVGCIIPLPISVALIYYYMMLRSLRPIDKNSYNCEDDDEKWIYGFFYYNKEDPSVLVDKRFGAGGTINFGNPKGKAIGIILLVITVGSLILPFML